MGFLNNFLFGNRDYNKVTNKIILDFEVAYNSTLKSSELIRNFNDRLYGKSVFLKKKYKKEFIELVDSEFDETLCRKQLFDDEYMKTSFSVYYDHLCQDDEVHEFLKEIGDFSRAKIFFNHFYSFIFIAEVDVCNNPVLRLNSSMILCENLYFIRRVYEIYTETDYKCKDAEINTVLYDFYLYCRSSKFSYRSIAF